MSVHPVCLSANKVPRAVPWLAIEPTSLKRLQNHLMLITKWNLRLRTEVPQQKFPIPCPTHVLHLGRTPKTLLFCTRKHTHVSWPLLNPLLSSQPASPLLFLARNLQLQPLLQDPSVPLYTLLFSISQHPYSLDYCCKTYGQFCKIPCGAPVHLWASFIVASQKMLSGCTCVATMVSIHTL